MKWMLPAIKKQFEALQPLVKNMNGKRAGEFAELMANCESAAMLANKLEGYIDDCKIKAAELTEGMNPDDSKKLEAYLGELDLALGEASYHLYGVGRYEAMFGNLQGEALSVEEEKQEAEVSN